MPCRSSGVRTRGENNGGNVEGLPRGEAGSPAQSLAEGEGLQVVAEGVRACHQHHLDRFESFDSIKKLKAAWSKAAMTDLLYSIWTTPQENCLQIVCKMQTILGQKWAFPGLLGQWQNRQNEQ